MHLKNLYLYLHVCRLSLPLHPFWREVKETPFHNINNNNLLKNLHNARKAFQQLAPHVRNRIQVHKVLCLISVQCSEHHTPIFLTDFVPLIRKRKGLGYPDAHVYTRRAAHLLGSCGYPYPHEPVDTLLVASIGDPNYSATAATPITRTPKLSE